MVRQRRAIAAWLGCALAALVMGLQCNNPVYIENFDHQTRLVEFSQSGYALMLGCRSQGAEDFLWEFFDSAGAPLDVGFYDVGATTNSDGVLVDEKFTGTSRPHKCWQPVDLHQAGAINFKNPGPLPHGYVRLTINGGEHSVTHPFRIGSTTPKTITLINTNGYTTLLDEPYQRWFRGDEVLQDLLGQREIDPSRQVWFMGFNQPEQSWAGSNEFFFRELGDGRNLQAAVTEAFAAVDAHNATAAVADQIPRGWFGIDFDRIDLARKRDPARCCVDDGTGNCDPGLSITSPNKSFLGCGGPYGSTGGPEEWCGVDGVGGVGTSTCHEADGSYGGLEGIEMPGGELGKPDSLTTDKLVYVERTWVDYQDDLYGVQFPPCSVADFRDFDQSWFCGAYDTKRCVYGPDAGNPCGQDSDCNSGACRDAVPIFYGAVEKTFGPRPPGGFSNPWCRNPYGYCAGDPGQTCESSADCGGTPCKIGQDQDHCMRQVSTGVGIWDRRDAGTRASLIGMILHTLEEAWNLRPGTPTDHFTLTFGGEGLFYYDRGSSCRGDRRGCDELDSSDNTFAHKDDQFAYADINDHRMQYRNPTKAGEYEHFDSKFYGGFVDGLAAAGYSNEAFLVHHNAKHQSPLDIGVSNRFWWMTEPARQKMRSDGRGNLINSVTVSDFIPGGLNGQAPEARADSAAYAFRADQIISLTARHSSIDDGRPTVGTNHTQGALWSSWMIDPADDPASNCPEAKFQGPGWTGKGPTALCTTQSPDCSLDADGLCAEASRDTCRIDPADPAWGQCRNLLLNVFDYDNRTSGICSENASKRCTSDRDCTASCQPRTSIGAANVGIPVALTQFSPGQLTAQVDLDFGGAGCVDSEGANRATYVADPADADCDAGGGLRDEGGRAHVEVLDQASPPFGNQDVVVLEGSFRKAGGGVSVSTPSAKLGFGYISGQGWDAGVPIDPSSRVVRNAATRNGPQLWFGGSEVYLGCVDRISGGILVNDHAKHDFTITWHRDANWAELEVDSISRSCSLPAVNGDVGGFLIVPADSWIETGQDFPFDILWSDLSLHGAN